MESTKNMYQDVHDTNNKNYKVIKSRIYFNFFQFIFFNKKKKMNRDSST